MLLRSGLLRPLSPLPAVSAPLNLQGMEGFLAVTQLLGSPGTEMRCSAFGGERATPFPAPRHLSGAGEGELAGKRLSLPQIPVLSLQALSALSQPSFALTLVCKCPSALTGGTGGWEGGAAEKEDFAPQKGFCLAQAWADLLHPCLFAVPGPTIALGLGWWCNGVQFPHLAVSPAERRQERRDLESTTLRVVQSVSGTSSHASTKALGARRRVLSVSLCRLDTASFSITPL